MAYVPTALTLFYMKWIKEDFCWGLKFLQAIKHTDHFGYIISLTTVKVSNFSGLYYNPDLFFCNYAFAKIIQHGHIFSTIIATAGI